MIFTNRVYKRSCLNCRPNSKDASCIHDFQIVSLDSNLLATRSLNYMKCYDRALVISIKDLSVFNKDASRIHDFQIVSLDSNLLATRSLNYMKCYDRALVISIKGLSVFIHIWTSVLPTPSMWYNFNFKS